MHFHPHLSWRLGLYTQFLKHQVSVNRVQIRIDRPSRLRIRLEIGALEIVVPGGHQQDEEKLVHCKVLTQARTSTSTEGTEVGSRNAASVAAVVFLVVRIIRQEPFGLKLRGAVVIFRIIVKSVRNWDHYEMFANRIWMAIIGDGGTVRSDLVSIWIA